MFARFAILGLILFAGFAAGQDKLYPEATSGKGKVSYVNGFLVIVLQGTPEEIGTQYGELVLKPAKPLIGRVDKYMVQIGWEKVFPTMVKLSGLVFINFPADQQKEVSTAAKIAGVDKNLLTALNAIPDLAKLGGCSTLVVEPNRSQTEGPLFGRNLDWPPFEGLPEFTSVIVFKPKGKQAFAAVTFPVLIGCLSGMNEAGLSLAINEITESKDKSTGRNITGTPMMMLFRRILEECKTIDEAEAILKKADRTTWFCLTLCDPKSSCVLEVTPKNVVRRSAIQDVCCCTNHFRTDELSLTKKCDRYPKLEAIQTGKQKLGVKEVFTALGEVHQDNHTVQSMIFEPKALTVHVSKGTGTKSATEIPLTKIDLKPFFQNNQ
ncbi:C45 family autoproteolytic acyltransferase/hydolase [Zavarzinella formosa]|uniref:C45 family autoproteolytic acyltransferase/hydolase n=1 Tax=Zavarzinella formosa TaxID=360055 RepID=UPI000314FC1F|nr:C45 family peptidase [Zavarzinella formosa]